jgi:general secretion pathway protein K
VERATSREIIERDDKTGQAREQGFVLLVVLWVLTSAVLLVASFNAAVRSGAASTVSEVGLTKLDAILDAGLEVAAAHLIDKNEKRRWRGDGSQHRLVFADTELTITVRDASGLVDLNKSDAVILHALFQKFTKSMSKAELYTNVILAARDAAAKDGNLEAGKSENSGTQNARSFAPVAFIDVWQLGRTQGIPRDVFEEVAPFLTVYSGDGTIYPATAPTQVLEAIPEINYADIEKIRYANKAALIDFMAKFPSFLTNQNGPARLVTVRAKRSGEDTITSRTTVIAIGVDPGAPYRLLAKWPTKYGTGSTD